MCLYPKLVLNPKYKANKKNKGIIPVCTDKRKMYVPVGCTKCMECRKQRAAHWRIRLKEDIKTNTNAKFVTLTFSNEGYTLLSNEIKGLTGYELDNAICKLAVKRYRERWRKKYKKSLRHWLTTEIGGTRYENVHMHGFVYSNEIEDIKEIWKYGFVFVGKYVNEESIGYMTKYVHKTDIKHKEYTSIVLTSPGIGKNYINREDAKKNKYNGKETIVTYRDRKGRKQGMPIYYRNKIYTEEEKENLWMITLDKQERWVLGQRIDISKNEDEYWKTLKWARITNKQLGYGDNTINWERKQYEYELRKVKQQQKINAYYKKLDEEKEKLEYDLINRNRQSTWIGQNNFTRLIPPGA